MSDEGIRALYHTPASSSWEEEEEEPQSSQ